MKIQKHHGAWAALFRSRRTLHGGRMMVDQENAVTNDADVESHAWMLVRKPVIALFVDRATQQWIVRDHEGQYWIVPFVESPWHHRQPFELADDTQLEPVPGHYKPMLGVPL